MAQSVRYGVVDKEMYLFPDSPCICARVRSRRCTGCLRRRMPGRQAHARARPRTVRLLPGFDSATYRPSLSGEGHPVGEGHGPVVPEPSFSVLQVESPDSRSLLFGIVIVGDVQAVPGAVYHGKVGNAHLVPSPAVREVGGTSCSRVEAEHSGVAHVAGVEVLVVVEGQAENEPACRSYRLDARPICGDPVDLPRLSPAPDVAALIDRDPLGVAESRLAEYTVEEDLGAVQGQYGFQGFISPLFRGNDGSVRLGCAALWTCAGPRSAAWARGGNGQGFRGPCRKDILPAPYRAVRIRPACPGPG